MYLAQSYSMRSKHLLKSWRIIEFYLLIFLKFWFTPCKAGQLLQVIELQEKEEDRIEKNIEKLFGKDPKMKGVN